MDSHVSHLVTGDEKAALAPQPCAYDVPLCTAELQHKVTRVLAANGLLVYVCGCHLQHVLLSCEYVSV